MLSRRSCLHLAFVIAVSMSLAALADDGVRTVLVEAVRPGLELAVNKGCGATYTVGETIDVKVRSELEGYLTLFDFTTDGQVHRIFPNQHYQDNWIDRDVEYTIPGNLLPFLFRVAAPEGEELLLAIVTSCPFEVLADEYYDDTAVFPLLLLGELAAAKTIAGTLGSASSEIQTALDVVYFTVSLTPQTDDELPPEVGRKLTVTVPEEQTRWEAGSDVAICWSSEEAGDTVRIEYSIDDGASWRVIFPKTSNDGSQGWTIPDGIASNTCRIRVGSIEYPDVTAVSSLFAIDVKPTPEPEIRRELVITVPTENTVWTAGTQETIRWSSEAVGSEVRIQYSIDEGASWKTIVSSTKNDGAYTWAIPSSIAAAHCQVRVISCTYPAISATSECFRIERRAEDEGEVYALFVAISDYKSDDNDLDYPVSQNIVARMRTALESWIDHVKVLSDRAATRSGILREIDTFLGQAGPEDTVYFHFAGHGTQVPDKSGDELDGYDEAIVPQDERCITDDEIDERFETMAAKRAILVFESCHSGTMERGLDVFTIYDPTLSRDIGFPGGTMLDDLQSGTRAPGGPDVLYMTACGPDQNAKFSDSEDGLSLFAMFLSLALTDYGDLADDDEDSWVSLQEAFELASRSLIKWVDENTDDEQEPQIVDRIRDPVNVVEVEN